MPWGHVRSEPFAAADRCYLHFGLAFAQRLFPRERVRHDHGKIVETRSPAQRLARAIGIRPNLREIALASRRALDWKNDAGNALDGIDRLEHRKAVTVAAIER